MKGRLVAALSSWLCSLVLHVGSSALDARIGGRVCSDDRGRACVRACTCRQLRTELMNKARQRAAPLVIEDKAAAITALHQGGGGGGGGGEGMGIDTDEALDLLLAAWRMHRQQQVEMLTQRFHEADKNGDGVLSIAEFWDCMKVRACMHSHTCWVM